MLEIGNNGRRLPGFKTMDIKDHGETDFIADMENGIPLKDRSCEVVYLSHVLEHIPWFKTEWVLKEIYRVLQVGGFVEIHVPDAAKIMRAYLEGNTGNDDWWHENSEHDLTKWLNGRIFSYGPDENWHKALFTKDSLSNSLLSCGFKDIKSTEPRGISHGWINLGLSGRKL